LYNAPKSLIAGDVGMTVTPGIRSLSPQLYHFYNHSYCKVSLDFAEASLIFLCIRKSSTVARNTMEWWRRVGDVTVVAEGIVHLHRTSSTLGI
jgi:hypothetical protein